MNLLAIFQPGLATRPVDCGKVRCPVEARDMDIENCVSCQHLREVARGVDGELEITCRPRLSALKGGAFAIRGPGWE
jgi:hypothetical protein